jgi:hypothetical protein
MGPLYPKVPLIEEEIKETCHRENMIPEFWGAGIQKAAVAINMNKTPWFKSASELYRPSDRRLSARLVPTFGDRSCHVVSVTDPYAVFSVF